MLRRIPTHSMRPVATDPCALGGSLGLYAPLELPYTSSIYIGADRRGAAAVPGFHPARHVDPGDLGAGCEPQGTKGVRELKSKKKPIPEFRSEEEAQEFWSEHDSADYIDWSRARPVVLANLHPSTKTISLRLPEHMLEKLKLLANKRDVPYQSLLKLFLAERIEAELRRMRGSAGSVRPHRGLTSR